jgi:hypothetical protein
MSEKHKRALRDEPLNLVLEHLEITALRQLGALV